MCFWDKRQQKVSRLAAVDHVTSSSKSKLPDITEETSGLILVGQHVHGPRPQIDDVQKTRRARTESDHDTN